MTTDYLILTTSTIRPSTSPPVNSAPRAPQDCNMTMAVFLPYNNIKHDGIASSILGIQLQTMWLRIDGVSEHQLETSKQAAHKMDKY